MKKYTDEDRNKVVQLCDGKRSSRQIAEETGLPIKWIQKLMKKLGLPRLPAHSPQGELNHAWKGGRIIEKDGYVTVPAPKGHPYAKVYSYKKIGRIFEHRLVMEQHIGRYLTPLEVVDHINGCTIDNRIENLRLFENNGKHLAETLKGRVPQWSEQGLLKIRGKSGLKIDTYNHRKVSGEIRKHQIHLFVSLHGKKALCLLGMERYLDCIQND